MENKAVWLEQIAITCSMTLSLLNKKAEEQGKVAEEDQLMSDVCMGYLYLLNVCDTTGALDKYPEYSIGKVLNRTIH
jgi:hypothetical protein|tara:strand:+ start:75 stop:305 length:231 start_codon:yes stop_codon:yes gene_type:complete